MTENDLFQAFDVEEKPMSHVAYEAQRMGFIRKVFSIISIQLAFTMVFCILSYSFATFAKFQIDCIGVFYVCFFIGFMIECTLLCCQNTARQVPTNYILLGSFTFCESWIVSTICSITIDQYQNGGQIVLLAAILTLAISISLTIYAYTTESDFTKMGGALFIVGCAVMFFGLFVMFTNSPVLHLLYLCIATVLFGFYLIHDVQLITGGKTHELFLDDYIVGALIVYMDIIVLFLQTLRILSEIMGKK